MNRSIALFASVALAAPALAGSAPGFVSSYDISTSTFARIRTSNVNSDTDNAASFFGSISSSSFVQDIQEGDVEGGASGDASLAVSGTSRLWNLQSVLDTNAYGLNYESQSDADFFFTVNMDLSAGQSIEIDGMVDDEYDGSDKSLGYGYLTINIFRDNTLVFTDEFHQGAVDVFEGVLSGASYRLEIIGRSDSGAYAGPGGWSSSDVFMTDLSIAIVPAPASLAPLAFAGVFAARRRRA